MESLAVLLEARHVLKTWYRCKSWSGVGSLALRIKGFSESILVRNSTSYGKEGGVASTNP